MNFKLSIHFHGWYLFAFKYIYINITAEVAEGMHKSNDISNTIPYLCDMILQPI